MTKTGWTNESIKNKLEALRQMCLENEMPVGFPQTLQQFCDWSDEARGLKAFTRPVLYKSETHELRKEAQRLMDIATKRWGARSSGRGARVSELEALVKMLSSRYHEERQSRIDAERSAAALSASVASLSTRLREITGSRYIKLVSPDVPSEKVSCD